MKEYHFISQCRLNSLLIGLFYSKMNWLVKLLVVIIMFAHSDDNFCLCLVLLINNNRGIYLLLKRSIRENNLKKSYNVSGLSRWVLTL